MTTIQSADSAILTELGVITVASGKGGTGKTTIATGLAQTLAKNGTVPLPPLFLDCDVEAPNAHLFLNPKFEQKKPVGILIPSIDEHLCTHCGKCAEICQYHAIAVLSKKTLVFPQLCHGCGSCTALCPEQAIAEVANITGYLEQGKAVYGIRFARGILNIGEPMAVPLINQLKKWTKPLPKQLTIIDSPPGTSCPVVASMSGCDFLVLVTEPTPFGLHDLKLAVQVARELRIPAGVIINRDNGDFSPLESFCNAEKLAVLMRIPFDRGIAEGIARGKNLIDIRPEFEMSFIDLYEKILSLAQVN